MVQKVQKILTPCCGSILYREGERDYYYFSIGKRFQFNTRDCSFCNTKLIVNDNGVIAGMYIIP